MAKLIAGLGEVVASRSAGDELVAYGLGSCVGLLAHDVATGAWALGHIVLPGPPPKTGGMTKPSYYASVGVDAVLSALRALAPRAANPQIALVGGASPVDGLASFDIGRKNALAARRWLWAQGLAPSFEELEGTESRTVSVDVSGRRFEIRNPQAGRRTVDLVRVERA